VKGEEGGGRGEEREEGGWRGDRKEEGDDGEGEERQKWRRRERPKLHKFIPHLLCSNSSHTSD